MWNKNIFCALFGIILVAGLAQSASVDAIQDINGQLVSSNISCYTCQGTACNAAVSTLNSTQCDDAGAECITIFSLTSTTTVTARGCSNLLSSIDNATCVAAAGKFCFSCLSSNCNVATRVDEYIDCFQCDSYSNSECVWNATNVVQTQCLGQCLVALIQKSATDNATFETYRGCASDASALGFSTCDGTGNCWSCNDSNCNSFNEPNGRLTCNFCSNSECNQTFTQDCLSYRADDKCAYILNNDSSISYLACASNFDSTTIPYMVGLGIMVECNGANCNTLARAPQISTSPVSCVSCYSENNEMCATNPSNVTSTIQCDDLNKMCISEIKADGNTFRGCLSNQPQVDFMECYSGSNDSYCLTCNGTNCNNQIFPANRIQCYVCNSMNDSSCEANPATMSVCPIYSPNGSCIQYLDGNTTVRGCSQIAQTCQNLKECKQCTGNGCNNSKLTNGASTIQVTGAVLGATLLLLAYRALGL